MLDYNNGWLFNCKKKTIRYAYGSEKVLPLSQKMHLYVLE
ncbi:hypothetical protein JMUB7537_28060 [Staphylococcus aureus]|nr:hypothetical protein HMPREF1625_02707 [Staphylococcus aureus 880]